jgi:pSer/pThr/pTyr-binding forkhead associated (FHA) protein
MSAKLVFLSGEREGAEIELTGEEFTIGRLPGLDLSLQHNSVSRHQATVWCEEGQYFVRDDQSTNGTFVNNRKVSRQVLKDGDVVEFGLGGPFARFESGAVRGEPADREETGSRAARGPVSSRAGRETVSSVYLQARNLANARAAPSQGASTATVMKEFVRLTYLRSKRRTRIAIGLTLAANVIVIAALGVVYWRGQQARELAELGLAKQVASRPDEAVSDRGGTRSEDAAEPPVVEREGKDFALLIAINEYENWSDLANPVVDARAIGEELERTYGFEVDLVENPAVEEIRDLVHEYASRPYSEQDQLLVFVAAHGSFDEQFIQDGFIAARDSKKEVDDPYKLTAIQYSWLRRRLASATAKHVLLVLDACYGGTFDERVTLAGTRGDDPYELVDPATYIGRKMQLTTRRYITSGGKERVPDGRPEEHSPFARRLLEALRSYGGEDGLLTLAEVHTRLQLVEPEPRAGEFDRNEPGSDFVFLAKVETPSDEP